MWWPLVGLAASWMAVLLQWGPARFATVGSTNAIAIVEGLMGALSRKSALQDGLRFIAPLWFVGGGCEWQLNTNPLSPWPWPVVDNTPSISGFVRHHMEMCWVIQW